MAKSTKKTAAAKPETNLVRRVTMKSPAKSMPNFKSGDTLNVYVKVREGEKERIQLYRGIVTKISGKGAGKTFTVRKISAGVGVERIFPFSSPAIDRVELVSTGKVRRSRLFYLRGLEGKASRVASELVSSSQETSEEPTNE
ncbi:MAG: 50S ribosomal protein L19 [Bdellovibrionaceae bacterium]|nr:50S ribosomal protein L19 [Pseudobdellovibrionaceae bacterium]